MESEVFLDGYHSVLKKQRLFLENKHLISPIALQKLKDSFYINFTHNSTAIEGNTLTKLETKVLLEDKISVGGKSLREVYEVVNHHKATLFAEECVAKNMKLDEQIIKDIHAILCENIMVGGVYRNEPVAISGASVQPPAGQIMYQEIKFFYSDLIQRQFHNPIELAAFTHAEFVRIHPFTDGNGRTSRQLLNYQLMMHEFPPIVINNEDKLNYYIALDQYGSSGDLTAFYQMVMALVEESLDHYLKYIDIKGGTT